MIGTLAPYSVAASFKYRHTDQLSLVRAYLIFSSASKLFSISMQPLVHIFPIHRP